MSYQYKFIPQTENDFTKTEEELILYLNTLALLFMFCF